MYYNLYLPWYEYVCTEVQKYLLVLYSGTNSNVSADEWHGSFELMSPFLMDLEFCRLVALLNLEYFPVAPRRSITDEQSEPDSEMEKRSSTRFIAPINTYNYTFHDSCCIYPVPG